MQMAVFVSMCVITSVAIPAICCVTCDQAVFFSRERESVAARESTLALPHFLAPAKKKRTPGRRLCVM